MADVIEYLRDLVALTGPSGVEEDVVRTVVELVRPLVDTVRVDALGNVHAERQGQPGMPRALLAAHMDEVGFRVKGIEPGGFLRFEKVGGADNRVLLGQRVWVRTGQGRFPGVIGTRSAHLLRDTDRTTVPPHTEQYVDIGARSEAEARQMGIQVGDAIGFMGDLTELGKGSGRYTAHALDDRVGCAIVLAALAELAASDSPVPVAALFTVQEEVGLRGAQAVAGDRQGDVALALETTASDDTPEIGGRHLQLGAGAAIKVMDHSLQVHPAVRRALDRAAAETGIPVQHEVLMGIGTDAGALQFAGAGLPAGVISVATRYTHSPVEVLDRADLEGAVQLLTRFIASLPDTDLRYSEV